MKRTYWVVSGISWLMMIFILLLFTTDILDTAFNYGIHNGYEGALGRIAKTYLLFLLSFFVSTIAGAVLLRRRMITLRHFLVVSVIPPVVLTAFTVPLVTGFVY